MKNNYQYIKLRLIGNGLLWLIIIVSCKSDRKNELVTANEDYKFYHLKGEGWKSKSIAHFVNDIQYKATEVPLAYYFFKNREKNDLSSLDSLLRAHENERIIEFEFEHTDEEDLLENRYTMLSYQKSVMYMSSTIQKDFAIVTSKGDTIPCSGVHFERHFKISPFTRILLYFGNVEKDEYIQLLYKDNLYNNGLFKFKFDENPIKT